MKGVSGRLRYPTGTQSTYSHNVQCAWVIRTNETLVLNVTFSNFLLEDSTECRFDWLQINDGHSAGNQLIGRFCGSHKPLGGNIISSTHQLYLWFRSDNSTSKEGFDLEWNSIEPQCGGLVNVTSHGKISSPGSPGNYPKNRDCRWRLKAANDKRLKLTFFTLQIEKHDSCNYDYLEVSILKYHIIFIFVFFLMRIQMFSSTKINSFYQSAIFSIVNLLTFIRRNIFFYMSGQ